MSGSNDCDPCLNLAFNIGGSCERSSTPLPLLIGILLAFNPNVGSAVSFFHSFMFFFFFKSLSLSLCLSLGTKLAMQSVDVQLPPDAP